MNKLSVSYINRLSAKLEKFAAESVRHNNLNRALRLLKTLSYLRYTFYLGIKNDFIENNIIKLAQHIKKSNFTYNKVKKSIVIIDEINADYIGLMIQYLSALVSGGYHILYIYEQREHRGAVRESLMQTLQSYEKARLRLIPSSINGLHKSQWIYNEICAFGSKNILMHFGEWAIEECVACTALPECCNRYRINIADHCFWAGVSCVDYTYEFRHYGANLSYKERGVKQSQIIYIPFYPVMKEVSFKGFPEECVGKFIFLTGGSSYKIVDENLTFFRLCKYILDKCPNSIILFAGSDGKDNSFLSNGIEQYGLQGKILPIGYRNDILEVFRHCDVFINTYPVSGGLMCQYAAQCSKPIINFKNDQVEECIAQKKRCNFTCCSEDEFKNEAFKLYCDSEYRKTRGTILHDAVVSKEEFENAFLSFIETGERKFKIDWNENFVPKVFSTNNVIDFYNKKLTGFYYNLFRLLGVDFIKLMPGELFLLVFSGVKIKIKKLIKRMV